MNINIFPWRYSRWVVYPLAALIIYPLLQQQLNASSPTNGFDLSQSLVPIKEIYHGGPPRDGIPSLDHPEFLSPGQINFLTEQDPVMGVTLDGIARAYPLKILNLHEIVNDRIGGTAIAITYCPLCRSGLAFFAQVEDKELEFGVSGMLYNSDVLLYDRQTESLWSQLKRVAVTGPMKGTRLKPLASEITTWKDWRGRYPLTEVLSDNTGHARNYDRSPYMGYDDSSLLFFPVSAIDDRYHPKELVIGLEIDGGFRAYPFAELRKSPAIFTDEFKGQRVQVLFQAEHASGRILDSNGKQIPTVTAFWFAWYAFHPETEVYQGASD